MTPINTQGKVQKGAMAWSLNDAIAVAVEADSALETLQIYVYDSSVPSLMLNATTAVTDRVTLVKRTVLAVDWNLRDTCNNLLAIGLQGDEGQLMQLYKHDITSGTITYRSGIDGLGSSVRAVAWHPCGRCLALGKNGYLDDVGQFMTYSFNKSLNTFSLVGSFDTVENVDVETVRWAPNGYYCVSGNDVQFNVVLGCVSIYKNDCIPVSEFLCRIQLLADCCDQLGTSTGQLQSQIDALVSI